MAVQAKGRMRKAVVLCALLAISSGASRTAAAAGDLASVLARLDASAARFKSAQAGIVWDNVQTLPIADSDKQVGTLIIDRANGQVRLAVHLTADNGRPIHKDLVYAGGTGKLYDALLKQMQVFQVGNKQAQLDTFLTLGFGGSGKDLEKSWTVTYQGTEQADGVAAAKLQLIPRDPEVAKTAPRVLLWIDMDKGVAVKQQRFDASGNYVIFAYSDIKTNVSIPSNAFTLKPPAGTEIVNH